jgi:hypothetical protein
MLDVKWLDGKSAFGKYILEINFSNNTKGYIKNDSYEQIIRYKNLMETDSGVESTVVHDYSKV